MVSGSDYQVDDYARMLNDAVRMDAYVNALCKAVKPDSVVLDLGTGTGFFALLACRLGARKVFAVDASPAVDLARESASANACADRVTCFQGSSFEISMPEPVDIIVSDLRGVMPLYGRHIPSVVDARRRFLRPGGILIPRRDTLFAAIVSSEEWYATTLAPLLRPLYGIDASCLLRFLYSRFHRAKIQPEQLLAGPIPWLELDYRTVTTPNAGATLTWVVPRPGVAHGIGLWFEAELDEETRFSTAPGESDTVYGRALLPWPGPVDLDRGDVVRVALRAKLIDDDYVWSWNTRVETGDSPGRAKAQFRQSTLGASIISRERLRKQADGFSPSLSIDGEVEQFILSRMQGNATLIEIARTVSDRFPDMYPGLSDALARVKSASLRYSQ